MVVVAVDIMMVVVIVEADVADRVALGRIYTHRSIEADSGCINEGMCIVSDSICDGNKYFMRLI